MRVTLRITITLGIVLVTVATAVSLLTLHYISSRESLAGFTSVLLEPLATLVGEKSDSFLGPVERAALLSGELVESAGASPAHFDQIEDTWYSLLSTHADLFYVQYGDVDGNFQLLTRRADGSLATQRIVRSGDSVDETWRERAPHSRTVLATRPVVPGTGDAYDPRARPWYRGAIASDGVFWTPVYMHAAERRPVITAARRIRVGGRIVGVTSVTVALDQLTQFVGQLRIAKNGHAFIADREGHLIAGSNGALLRSDGDVVRLPSIAEAGGPELLALSRLPEWNDALAGTMRTVRFTVGGEGYLGVVRPLKLHRDADWVIATLLPEDDFLAPVQHELHRHILVSAAITLVFVGLGLFLARAVGSALGHVARATEELQRLNFDGAMPRSRFREIEQVYRTYDRLKEGLRAFEKYAPLRLVRMLLEGEVAPSLGGRVGTVTVLFSDIRNFTALAERMKPEEVAVLLGEYFQCLSDIVGGLHGTVDKFIGDGVMAFWNAPRADEHHALHAVLAALRCRAAVAALPQADQLFTRFGLHTGEVMVGNFGARDRFAYTLLGDGVNLAARIEGANKEYGTQILISEPTALCVSSGVLCRHIDRVAVKGKSQPTNVYEAICPLVDATPEDLALVRNYEAALAQYLAGNFAHAAALFGALAARCPDDGPTATMVRRCQRLIKDPPQAVWHAVHELAK